MLAALIVHLTKCKPLPRTRVHHHKLENHTFLSDEGLANLAHHRPLLQVVELCDSPWSWNRHVVQRSLSLVTIYPELRHVGLVLDGRKWDPANTTPHFPNSPIKQPGTLHRKVFVDTFCVCDLHLGVIPRRQISRGTMGGS